MFFSFRFFLVISNDRYLAMKYFVSYLSIEEFFNSVRFKIVQIDVFGISLLNFMYLRDFIADLNFLQQWNIPIQSKIRSIFSIYKVSRS